MSLRPEVSLPVALATATVVYTIHSQATPTMADIRVGNAGNADINSARRSASWVAAAVVGAISLISKDPTVFIVGGGMVVLMDVWTRHANAVNPITGKASTAPSGAAGTMQPDPANIEMG